MENDVNNDERVELLCKRMGRMWSDKVTRQIAGTGVREKIKDGSLTLIGKLLQNPRINFQAFQNTMKKVWRVENSEFIPLDEGIFAVTFVKENEMRRVQEQGPWYFANSLLLLQSWKPDTPAVAYIFTSCMFWIHVMGVPFEWGTTELLREIVGEIGTVHDMKMETRGMVTYGKVRVQMNLDKPLQSGVLVCHGGKKVWLDFKYERLPKFCYFCGKIGHYIAECNDCASAEENMIVDDERFFGPWLKAEEAGRSPFWKIFYEGAPVVEMEEERDMGNEGQIVVYAKEGEGASSSDAGLRTSVDYSDSSYKKVESGYEKVEFGGELLGSLGVSRACPVAMGLKGEIIKSSGCGKKAVQRKKVKRYCPYDSMEGSTSVGHEERLFETPIQIQEYSGKWAVVASPNKPPES